jgi:surfactin synthase thioesterase subunit/MFS family permease
MHITSGLHYAMVSTLAADLGTPMLWSALTTGGCLHVLTYERAIDPEGIREYFNAHPIDVMKIVPSHFLALCADIGPRGICPRRLLVFGGESSYWKTFHDIWDIAPELEIQISYGPTESTVTATAFSAVKNGIAGNEADRSEVVPIGSPLDHVRVYVLNEEQKLLPLGLPGELYIGGEAVARGYLQQAELTQQKFLPDPFCGNPAGRMYATGDLVKLRQDGLIDFIGRKDGQTKIRGYRIELGEIQAALKNHPAIQDCAVLIHESDNRQKSILAYLVMNAEPVQSVTPPELRSFLKDKIPDYMIPAGYIFIERIPLTANGKLDRKALPLPDKQEQRYAGNLATPVTPLEVRLCEIWQEILDLEQVGIDDNFFDLGGDSFKAIHVVRKAAKHLSVIELFKYPTVRELAGRMEKVQEGTESTILHEFSPPNLFQESERINLVCIPYGGGNSITFQPLARQLPANYSLYAVEIPGHDFANTADEFQTLEKVAARCFEEIKQKVKGTIVVYGHCLGGALAIELARLLEENHYPLLGIVMAGNFPAPRLTGLFFRLWEKIFPRDLTISDRAILDMLHAWGGFLETVSQEEQQFVVKALRHDRREAESYYTERYAEKDLHKLRAPLVCVCGTADRTTEFYQERYRDWDFFSSHVELAEIEHAGHYFHKHQAETLADIIRRYAEKWQPIQSEPAHEPGLKPSPEITATNTAHYLARLKKAQPVQASISLFFLVAIGQLLAMLGSGIMGFALGVWVYEQTHVTTDFAIVTILNLLPGLLILPFAGAIADRCDRRLILIVSSIISMGSTLIIAFMLWFSHLDIRIIYVSTIIGSIAGAFQRPAYLAAIAQITPKRYLGQANGFAQMITATGSFIAPMLGGFLFLIIGLSGIIFIHFTTFLIAGCILCFVRFPNFLFRKREEPVLSEMVGGIRYIVRRKSLMIMIGFFLVFNLVWGIPNVLITPLVLKLNSPSALGLIIAAMSGGTIAGGIIMSIWGGTRRRTLGMIGFVVLAGLAFILMGSSSALFIIAAGAFISRLALSLINTHWQALIQSKVGLELQGRVFAINFLMANILLPAGNYLAGILSDRIIGPFMAKEGTGTSYLRFWAGFGEGQGMALIIFIAGILVTLWGIFGITYKPLRNLEDNLPDAIPGAVIIEDKDKIQELADLELRLKNSN